MSVETRSEYANWLAQTAWDEGLKQVIKHDNHDLYTKFKNTLPELSDDDMESMFIETLQKLYYIEDDSLAMQFMVNLSHTNPKLLVILAMQRSIFRSFSSDEDVRAYFADTDDF